MLCNRFLPFLYAERFISITVCLTSLDVKYHAYKKEIFNRHPVLQNIAMFQKDIIKKGWMSASLYSFWIQNCKGALVTFHMTLVCFYHAAEDGHNNKVKMYVVCVFICRQEMKRLSQRERKILYTCFILSNFQARSVKLSNNSKHPYHHMRGDQEVLDYNNKG